MPMPLLAEHETPTTPIWSSQTGRILPLAVGDWKQTIGIRRNFLPAAFGNQVELLHTVLKKRGPPPKYIASTATIRMAQDQVRRLYWRDLPAFLMAGDSPIDSASELD